MSIKANELRIGNWVIFNDNTDRYGIVKEIHEHYASLTCKYIPDNWEQEVIGTTIDYEYLNPIPLSPEIIEKAGFELKEGGQLPQYIEVGGLTLFWYGRQLSGNIGKITPHDIEIKYLHDFQNWYYYHHNKTELDINL